MEYSLIPVAHTDERGTIADILYKTPVDHAAIITSNKGALRGNHFHKETVQRAYVVEGAMLYFWREADSEVIGCRRVKAGQLVCSGPNEAHAMYFPEACTMIVFSSGVRGGVDYEADTFRVPFVTLEEAEKACLEL